MVAIKILLHQKLGSTLKVSILHVYTRGVEFSKMFSIVFQVLLWRVFFFLLPSQFWHEFLPIIHICYISISIPIKIYKTLPPPSLQCCWNTMAQIVQSCHFSRVQSFISSMGPARIAAESIFPCNVANTLSPILVWLPHDLRG